MLVDETKYLWSKGFLENVEVSKSPFILNFEQPLKIYRIEGSSQISIYLDEELTQIIFSGTLPFEPNIPIACDKLIFTTEETTVKIDFISEVGREKTILTPFLNTIENMDYIGNGYYDEKVFTTSGLETFKFNDTLATTMFISSNHHIGFGVNSAQLSILRRDGCSTAVLIQNGQFSNGIKFLKIRFEGYTVYNNRINENKLVFELFLLSNNDIFLNMIQTPTSKNTGISELVCGGKNIPLTLFDGSGGGSYISFYHKDINGLEWDISYTMYDQIDTSISVYLIKEAEKYYTIANDILLPLEITSLTSAMFLKYGFSSPPASNIIIQLINPDIYLWKSDGEKITLNANITASPLPQTLMATVDLNHPSILGIKMITAEFSGNIMIKVSIDKGISFSDGTPLSDWLNIDVSELWNSLNEDKTIIFKFILHNTNSLSRFKITYIN